MLITNGIEEKNVTKGAYNQFYKPLGYKPIVVIPYEEPKVVVEQQRVEIEKKEEIVSKKKTPKKSKK